MQPETVLHYISHRLKVAGGRPNVFSKQAAMLIHDVTGGVPRLINQLCDMSLTYAFAQDDQVVKRATVQSVLDDGIFFAPVRD
jgi:type II secretory pathway predicted ATPase ExeA